jgi:hypothetical protein
MALALVQVNGGGQAAMQAHLAKDPECLPASLGWF